MQVSSMNVLPVGACDGMRPVMSDKTIVGPGDDARLTGGRLNIGLPADDRVT